MTTNTMDCELFTNSLMAYLEREVDDATRVAMERHSVTCGECGALLADLRKLRIDAANLPTMQPSRDLWSGIAARIEAPVLDIGTSRAAVATPWRRRREWLRGALIAASLVAAAGIGYVAAGARGPQADPVPLADVAADTPLQVAMIDSAVGPRAESRAPGAEVPGAEVPGAEVPRAEVPRAEVPRAESTPQGGAPAAAAAPARSVEAINAIASLTADYDREIARLRTLIEQRRNQLDPVTVAVIEKNLLVIDTAVEDCKKAIARDPASRFLMESLNQSLQTKVELMRTAALLPSRT